MHTAHSIACIDTRIFMSYMDRILNIISFKINRIIFVLKKVCLYGTYAMRRACIGCEDLNANIREFHKQCRENCALEIVTFLCEMQL